MLQQLGHFHRPNTVVATCSFTSGWWWYTIVWQRAATTVHTILVHQVGQCVSIRNEPGPVATSRAQSLVDPARVFQIRHGPVHTLIGEAGG